MPTLVVETGSGLPDANAYIDVAFADEWHDNQGNEFWGNLSDDRKASSIIKATMYMDQRFKRRYRGLRLAVDQALGWPRIGAYDDDSFVLFSVPYQIERACAEYALRAAWYKNISPDPIRTVPDQDFAQNTPPASQDPLIIGPAKNITEKVGPLEESVTYDTTAHMGVPYPSRSIQTNVVDDFYIPQYPAADMWMEQVLRNSATGTRLVRGT